MKNHINIKCKELSNDEILIMTLIPHIKGKQNVDFEKIKYYTNTYNNSFNKIQELKQHIIMECFENNYFKF